MSNATEPSVAARSEVPGGLEPARRAKVCVFGRLRVIQPDGTICVPSGDAQRSLLVLLALRGGALHVEQAVDALWPGDSVERGNIRLGNVLSRLREMCGEIVGREGASIVLDADTDLAEFEAAAATVLALAATEFAPDAVYADWAAPVRRRLDSLREHLSAGL